MARRNELRVQDNRLLERVAWNAAAIAVLAVMLLVLLASLEWLDRVAQPEAAARSGRAGRASIAAEARDEAVVVAGRRAARIAKPRATRGRAGIEAAAEDACARPSRGSG